MSNSKFSKFRYLELLQKTNKLNHSEYIELLSYKVILQDQIFYNNRNLYISFFEQALIENVNIEVHFDSDFDLDNYLEIAGNNGFFKFSELYDQNIQDFKILENKILKEGVRVLDNFPINLNAEEFSDLIGYIHNLSECIGDQMDENEYWMTLENVLPELRSYADSASATFNDVEIILNIK